MNMDVNVMNTMLQTGMLAITIPIVLIVAWKLRCRKSLIPFWAGMAVFILFAEGLENIPHTLFLMIDSPISRTINGNVLIYALYAGLMAGLFEEVGRFVAFRLLLKKYPEKETAVTYGLGHGGIECILVLGIGYLQYYVYGQLLNEGTLQKFLNADSTNPQAQEVFQNLINALTSMKKTTCWLAGWERISALMLQVALSILVYQAVKFAQKNYLLWVSVVLHMAADIPAAFYQKGMLSLLPTEIIIFAFALAVFLYAIWTYQNMEPDAQQAAEEEKKHSLHQMANQRLNKNKKD